MIILKYVCLDLKSEWPFSFVLVSKSCEIRAQFDSVRLQNEHSRVMKTFHSFPNRYRIICVRNVPQAVKDFGKYYSTVEKIPEFGAT